MEDMHVSLADRYGKLAGLRENYLDRARETSKVTLQYIFPPDGFNSGEALTAPAQNAGTMGVKNLAAKLMQTQLPLTVSFFKMLIANERQLKLDPQEKTEIEAAFGEYERVVMRDIDEKNDRTTFEELLLHLIIGGNGLLHTANEGLMFFSLEKYVVRRDAMGQPLEIILKESFAPESLPAGIMEMASAQGMIQNENVSVSQGHTKTIPIYTRIHLVNERFEVYQMVGTEVIPGSEANYPKDKSPWLPLRMIKVSGEDYGRGYAEEYFGDLCTLEGLNKALIEGSAAAAKLFLLVAPNGSTDREELANAENCAIISGRPDDVAAVQINKSSDFQFTANTKREIEERLGFAFLMSNAVQRDAERVTAEEVRFMAQQLDSALGGIHSVLSNEFARPYLYRKIALLEREGKLPVIKKEEVQFSITTGLSALGRSADGARLNQFVSNLSQVIGPEQTVLRMNIGEFISRMAVSEGIDPIGLVKSEEEIQQEQQQAQQQQMANNVLPNAINQGGNLVNTIQQQQGEQGNASS